LILSLLKGEGSEIRQGGKREVQTAERVTQRSPVQGEGQDEASSHI
jgi:hypothetical protein